MTSLKIKYENRFAWVDILRLNVAWSSFAGLAVASGSVHASNFSSMGAVSKTSVRITVSVRPAFRVLQSSRGSDPIGYCMASNSSETTLLPRLRLESLTEDRSAMARDIRDEFPWCSGGLRHVAGSRQTSVRLVIVEAQ